MRRIQAPRKSHRTVYGVQILPTGEGKQFKLEIASSPPW